ncbi:MAG: TRAP transporter small permease [Phycisphaerae bacterium]|nr:TRAP transporter small permease [Phycisphaerae bacterium]
MTRLIATLRRINRALTRVLIAVAGLLLVGMMALTCADIFLRQAWRPVPGSVELVGFFGAVVTAFALSFTQNRREHIAVDILFQHYPAVLRRIVGAISYAACIAFCVVAAWQIGKLGVRILTTGEVTETLRIIFYPFVFAVALGFGTIALSFLADLLACVAGEDAR